jgi:acylphosphatase
LTETLVSGGNEVRTVRVGIDGRVQGVGFRYWTEEVAAELGVSGWVRNRRDGSVEALLCGDADAVAEMLQRCRDGPPSARVTAVRILQEGGDPPDAFEVLPTL